MAKDPPSQKNRPASGRFWWNLSLIALAHVALIAVLIRWSVAARASSNPESIVWLGASEASAEVDSEPATSVKSSTPAVEPTHERDEESEDETSAVTTAKSEIELPSATPKPTPTATLPPKPSASPTPKPKITSKPLPKPTPKKIVLAKASDKASSKAKSNSTKSSEKSAKQQTAVAKPGAASQSENRKTASAGGGNSASESAWYGHMLHDRFYSAWIQPTSSVPSGAKISALVNVRIEKDGRVSKFEIIKPSDNIVMNESVAAIPKRVSEVDAPPTALLKADHYDVKINFELNTESETP